MTSYSKYPTTNNQKRYSHAQSTSNGNVPCLVLPHHSSISSPSIYETLISSFPVDAKLSYETIIHNKVSSNYVIAIPPGKKGFIWFTEWQKQPICVFMEFHIRNQRIIHCQPIQCSFNYELTLQKGTILYGTWYIHQSLIPIFCMETILYSQGMNTSFTPFHEKWSLMNKLVSESLQQTKETLTNKPDLFFGLPIMGSSIEECESLLSYTPFCYHFHSMSFERGNQIFSLLYSHYQKKKGEEKEKDTSDSSSSHSFKPLPPLPPHPPPHQSYKGNKPTNGFYQRSNQDQTQNPIPFKLPQTSHSQSQFHSHPPPIKRKYNEHTSFSNAKQYIFQVRPGVETDIYNLYVWNEETKKEEMVDVAFIPSLKTSVWMNSLFRNIKENRNLDALEESDDEEEFQQDIIHKYVYLDRTFPLLCQWNSTFKKWEPICIIHEKEKDINPIITWKMYSNLPFISHHS